MTDTTKDRALELVVNPLNSSESGSHDGFIAEEEEYVEPGVHSGKGESSVAGAIANLVNCIVGAGIIGLPAAVRECGFFMGAFCLCIVAYLLYRSAVYLIECGEKLGKHNFESMAEHLYGRFGYYVTTGSMATFAYGGMTAYMVILGDTLPPVFSLFVENDTYSSREFLVLMSATFIMLPICMLKSLSDMVWASTLSVLADAALIIIILIEGPAEARRQGIVLESDHVSFIELGIFAGIGTMSFAFVMHHNSFIIYKSLKEPNMQNWRQVAMYSAVIALLFALTLGLGGYLIFNEHVNGDILNNFESNGAAVSTGKVLLAICMVLTYPVECFIARHCINSLIDYYRSNPYENLDRDTASSNKSDDGGETQINKVEESNQESDDSVIRDTGDDVEIELNAGPPSDLEQQDEASGGGDDFTGPDGSSKLTIPHVSLRGDASFFRSNRWHVLITLILWGSSTLLSLVFTDLAIVLSFTGCIAASNLGYILPALMYFATYKEELVVAVNAWVPSSLNYQPSLFLRISLMKPYAIPATLLVFGVCVMFIGITTIMLGGSAGH